MRRLSAGIAAAAILLALAVWPSSAVSNATITDNAFSPNPVPVMVGDRVTWRHNGSNPHSVTADNGSFDSSPNCALATSAACMGNGQTFTSPPFTQPVGTIIRYYCRIHGGRNGMGMSGTVVVQAAPTTTTTIRPTTTARPVTITRAATTSSLAITSTTETSVVETTTTEESTTTTVGDIAIEAEDGDGTNGLAVAALVLAILGVLGGGGYAIYRLRSGGV